MRASQNSNAMDDHAMPTSQVSKKRRRPTGVVAHERKDLQSCLEHLIAVGLKEKREAERYQEFRASGPPTTMAENEHQDRQNAATHTTSQVDEYSLDTANAKTRGNKSSALKEVFVEDIRLYGETSSFKYDGLERQPWPLSKRLLPAKTGMLKSQVVQNMDQNWELEYGDSIHPLAFSAARLSQRLVPPTSMTELNAINGLNLNVATTETSLAEQDVPRALLLRCWQRAVDTASQTTLASMKSDSLEITENGRNVGGAAAPTAPGLHPTAYQDVFSTYLFGGSILGLGNSNTDTGPIIPQPTPVEDPAFVAAQRELAKDRLTMKRKCTSLGLGLTRSQLPTDVSERACPACYRQFEQLNELQQHYYGERDQKGCCWRRIAQKEPKIVADILENHVKSQIDQYLGLIMDKALGKLVRDGDVDSPNRKRSRCFTWYDVLKFTEEAVNSSFDVEVSKAEPRKGTHPIFETLQRKSGCDPLVLNPAVLRSAQKRLIDRYAKVPR